MILCLNYEKGYEGIFELHLKSDHEIENVRFNDPFFFTKFVSVVKGS
jgi:hypothetical protein